MSTRFPLKLLGARLRAWRLARGLSQEQVAVQLGVSYQQIQKYERAQTAISLQRLVALASILRVDVILLVSDLVGEQADPVQGPEQPMAPSIAIPAVSDEGYRIGLLFDAIESPVVRRAVKALVRSVAAASDDVC